MRRKRFGALSPNRCIDPLRRLLAAFFAAVVLRERHRRKRVAVLRVRTTASAPGLNSPTKIVILYFRQCFYYA
jgi:hypothetical protein